MASDPTLPLRQAVVTDLRADAALMALGTPPLSTGDRIYGERTPATLVWPFVRYGQADVGQTQARLPLHVFSKSQYTDEVAAIAAGIVARLDGRTLELGDGRRVTFNWPEAGGTQIISDAAEADAWHAIVLFDVTIPRTCPA